MALWGMEQIEMADDIIIFPEFDKIKNEIERLRIELSMLLLERDELQFVICRNIEAKYTLEFGSIEYRAYEAQCTALRLKRKIELIQAKRNRQEPVSISNGFGIKDSPFFPCNNASSPSPPNSIKSFMRFPHHFLNFYSVE